MTFMMSAFKKIAVKIALIFLIIICLLGGAVSDRLFGYRILDKFFPRNSDSSSNSFFQQKITSEESVIIDVAQKASPSVVTINLTQTQKVFDPFSSSDPFGFFSTPKGKSEDVQQDIGSGFIIDKEGLIVTNKHVVENTQGKYKVITSDDKTYDIQKIYRDPVNDLAIIKIDPGADSLQPVELGDSGNLKVGQYVIAIGTALGEFRTTVTQGVISGLGRGITAGSIYEGYVERLDNVIQTDAAINPGNSGGPLFNSAGQVIGVNVAVAATAQNIGFAIPINVVKEAIDNFNKTGSFNRPFLGVSYQILSRDLALMNEVPQGAYVREVVDGSAAQKAGVKAGDIITKIDDQSIKEEDSLTKYINQKKIGDKVILHIWRDGEELNLPATLQESVQ